MKHFPKIPVIEIREQEPNSYTDQKPFIVFINGSRHMSGHTKEDALISTLSSVYRYKVTYESSYLELKRATQPLLSLLVSDQDE